MSVQGYLVYYIQLLFVGNLTLIRMISSFLFIEPKIKPIEFKIRKKMLPYCKGGSHFLKTVDFRNISMIAFVVDL